MYITAFVSFSGIASFSISELAMPSACQRLKATFQILKDQYEKVQVVPTNTTSVTWGDFGITKRSIFERLVNNVDTKKKSVFSTGEKGVNRSNGDIHLHNNSSTSVNLIASKTTKSSLNPIPEKTNGIESGNMTTGRWNVTESNKTTLNTTIQKMDAMELRKYADGKGLFSTLPVQARVVRKELVNNPSLPFSHSNNSTSPSPSNSTFNTTKITTSTAGITTSTTGITNNASKLLRNDTKFHKIIEILSALSHRQPNSSRTVIGQKREGSVGTQDEDEQEFLVKEIKATKDFLGNHIDTDTDECTAFENLMFYEIKKLKRYKRNESP